MTEQEMVQVFVVLAANYPTFEADPARLGTWLACLGGYDYKIVSQAVRSWLLKSKFVPTIAEINEEIRAIVAPKLEGMSAAEAWRRVRRVAQIHGSVDFEREEAKLKEHPALIDALERVGGIERVAYADVDYELKSIQKQFLATYEAYAEQIADRKLQQLNPTSGTGLALVYSAQRRIGGKP
jgi:Loader and inhibitor of phage G40P